MSEVVVQWKSLKSINASEYYIPKNFIWLKFYKSDNTRNAWRTCSFEAKLFFLIFVPLTPPLKT